MNETQQRPPTRYREEYFEDEIELMDYLRVIWKRRYLIIAGTLICAVAAAVISFSMPKVYRIDMVVRPGILGIEPGGNYTYVDSPGNIKATVEAGTFNREILDRITGSNSNNSGAPKSLRFKVNTPRGSNTLQVSYDTSIVDRGLQILAGLGQVLSKHYSERVAYFQNEYETEIGRKKAEAADYEAEKRALEQHIRNIRKRIAELTPQIDLVRKNTNSLIKERNKLSSGGANDGHVLSAVLYMNAIQHNILLENSYRQELNNYLTRKEGERFKLKELGRQLDQLREEIKRLEFKKSNVQSIEILQPPTAGQNPEKPKTKLNVMLATVVGLFAMLFLAFFLEYIQKHRGKLES
ncbi:MAG: hypothetical protein HWN68_07080 [Desulfobacterales bacterium]|nr:hypothetical protein [Desulfobacterales bacterium]